MEIQIPIIERIGLQYERNVLKGGFLWLCKKYWQERSDNYWSWSLCHFVLYTFFRCCTRGLWQQNSVDVLALSNGCYIQCECCPVHGSRVLAGPVSTCKTRRSTGSCLWKASILINRPGSSQVRRCLPSTFCYYSFMPAHWPYNVILPFFYSTNSTYLKTDLYCWLFLL